MRHILDGRLPPYLLIGLSFRSKYIYDEQNKTYECSKVDKPTTIDANLDFVGASFKIKAIGCHDGDSIFAGHYFCYIKQTTCWIKVNDRSVTEVRISEDDLLRMVSGDNMEETAYILLYEKDMKT